MKNIKTLNDACKALGTTVEEQFSVELKKLLTDDELAYRELKLIVKALNQSDGKAWEPDWSNWNEYKYFPWLEVDTSDGNKAGSGFSAYVCDCDYLVYVCRLSPLLQNSRTGKVCSEAV